MQPSIFSLFLVASLLAAVKAITFDLPAVETRNAEEGSKCFSQYVPHDTLVLAAVKIGEGYNQRVNIEVKMEEEEKVLGR